MPTRSDVDATMAMQENDGILADYHDMPPEFQAQLGKLMAEWDRVPDVTKPLQFSVFVTFMAVLLSVQSANFSDKVLDQMRLGVSINRDRATADRGLLQ